MAVDSFEELLQDRSDYIRIARKNGFEEGLRNLLSELYPDNAHFIYEILQNAEDARAYDGRLQPASRSPRRYARRSAAVLAQRH